jgi:translocation and assembly module TamB
LEAISLIHPLPVRGDLEGGMLLEGPLSSPRLEADFSSTLSLAALEPGRPPLQTRAGGTVRLGDGRIFATLSVFEFGLEPMRLEASFPAVFRLSPFTLDVPPGGALQGSLTGALDLRILTQLVLLEGHAVEGQLASEFSLEGTLSDPRLHGRMRLTGGRYENYNLALLMDNIEATLRATGGELVMESLTATDGQGGRMTAEGVLAMDPGRFFPFRSTLTFHAFQALRNPELSTRASGNIQLSGDTRSARAGGNISLDPLNLTLPDRTVPAIAQLKVTHINVGPSEREKRAAAAGPAYRVDLDLTIDLPARFFIRGRGLEAEFAGDLSITGTAAEPMVRGTLAVVRGDFTFLNRRFELTEANIIFTGATPPMPLLDITAEWSVQEITVLVRLTGKATEPEIALESDPALPSDEILSRVIFGRSVTDLTPLQALRLANALRILATGADNGFDIFGTLRTTFGLDELELREQVDGGTALDVGRYLHENVYLRLSKGLGTGRDKIAVEIEVHRYVSVESEVGTDAQGGLGINYRRNY